MNLFAQAQKSFLENSKEEAIAHFQAVTALLTTEDWPANDRRVFLQSYLRLAQLEPEKQTHWLNRALSTGDDVQPEEGLIPPPIVAQFLRLRREVPRNVPPISLFAAGWTAVLINGVPCAEPSCLGWPMNGDVVRVTFVSDIWMSETKLVSSHDLRTVLPSRTGRVGQWGLRKKRFAP